MGEGKLYMVEDSNCTMEDTYCRLKGMSCTVNWEMKNDLK